MSDFKDFTKATLKWTAIGGVYRQWSGHYLYSTQPMRLTIQPLVVNIQENK